MHDSAATLAPAPARPSQARVYGLLAEFTTPAAILLAAEKVRDAGYKWFDCHVPFPVHGLDRAMGVRPTILPILVFGAGATGTTVALLLQMLTNSFNFGFWALVPVHGYSFLVSGKPFVSLPAFIPVTFELTVLFASLGSFGLMLLLNNLPHLYHPVLKNKRMARATDDRFFLVIEARDPKFSRTRTEEFLMSLQPAAVEAVEA